MHHSHSQDKSPASDTSVNQYTCPMHPKVRQSSPGICPECGMKLIPGRGDDTERHGHHNTNIFKMKFWVSLILSIPVILYSDITPTLTSWSPPVFPGSTYLPLILGSIIFFYGGLLFIHSAYRELRAKLPGMMTLITIAILTAYIYSIFTVLTGTGHDLFWELSTLITAMLLGHWMEMRAVSGAQKALSELSDLIPDQAEVERHGKIQSLPLSEIQVDDTVLVKPGGRIPIDGSVTEGRTQVDESLVTGESIPVDKRTGDKVIAGTLNGDGSLKIRVTEIGEQTFLAGITRLVQQAQASKSRLQILSDRAAFYLTIIAIVGGVITLITWLSLGTADFAIERAVSVLVITCPHALGLAIPLVASISTTKAARNGFLVKQRLALEAARNIDIVLFDKTGTLTKGQFGINNIHSAKGEEQNDILRIAASVNQHSEHPIGVALVEAAKSQDLNLVEPTNFHRIAGMGVKATLNNRGILVGSQSLLASQGIEIEPLMEQGGEKLSNEGQTIIYVVVEKKLLGTIALSDIIRQESREAIIRLRQLGIQSAMITGDTQDVASSVAEELHLDKYFAKVLPGQKQEKIMELQKQGLKVAMVGDGINDAPALTQADLGIAIGAGTNVAIESAGIILVKNDPRDIVKIVKLSRLTYKKMVQNLFWATGYNTLAIPLAAGVLAAWGIFLQPAIAALLMSASTVIVASNALLLKRAAL